ncbi:replication protein P [Shewanella sp.]|uniref:replication protein P n=1 Tax=Shewanella sp. TaxID=50422 RepID=UPI003F2AC27D
MPVLNLYCVDFAKRHGAELDSIAIEYAERLVANGIGQQGLQRGIERLKRQAGIKPWTPNPEEFALMCKPTAEEYGIPSINEVYDEIVKARGRNGHTSHAFSHQIVSLINHRVGFDMYQSTAAEFRKKIETEYAYWLKVAFCSGLPQPKAALEHKVAPELPEYLKNAPKTLPGALGERIANMRAKQAERNEVQLTVKARTP